MLMVVVTQSFSDDSAIRYVLPVLWMTSRLPITGHMARGSYNKAQSDSPGAVPGTKS